ncbi:MAG: hypothetical protein NVSMB56_08100 [Pyrinomonadaceae bacterium]
MFYAPVRGMREVRDRAPFGAALFIAFVAHVLVDVVAELISLASSKNQSTPRGITVSLALDFFGIVGSAIVPLLLMIVVFVPIVILIANLFDRRGRFGIVLQQEFSSVASVVLYAWAAATLIAFPFAIVLHLSGIEEAAQQSFNQLKELQKVMNPNEPPSPEILSVLGACFRYFILIITLSPLPCFAVWMIVAVREMFRMSVSRSILIMAISSVLAVPTMSVVFNLMITAIGSPLILLLLFWLLRGYFTEMMRAGRARVAFKQNLEATTLNPADASAHYNLGLLHLQRKEFAPAQERFKRAIEIDADEIDAHFQLGRIAREQGRLTEAIEHFNETVARAPQHAQNEIWREVGATYLAANQFEDARDALERFLQERPSDAEALYLMGRALAGLGRTREATDAMHACIEAVKTAPAYKYRAEKRWLNEAQQFLRSHI